MIIDLSRPVTEWHQRLPPAAIARNILAEGGRVTRLPEGKDAQYIGTTAYNLGDSDVLVLPRAYQRLLPAGMDRNGEYVEIKGTTSFQKKGDMLEIPNSWIYPMRGLESALRTIKPDGHYVGICWHGTGEKPRKSVLMAAPMIEGVEAYFLFNGEKSIEWFKKAEMERPEIVVHDYGDTCVVRVPSRSHKEAKTITTKKKGTQYFHDVRASDLPLMSNDNHWADTFAETDNPDAVNKVAKADMPNSPDAVGKPRRKLPLYWLDDGVAAMLAIEAYKRDKDDPLRVRMVPLVKKHLVHLDNRLRYNVIIEQSIPGTHPLRSLSETERSYLLMSFIQALRKGRQKLNLYEYLFRNDIEGMEDYMLQLAD